MKIEVQVTDEVGNIRQYPVSGSYFKILDKDGIEMPDHYTGRRRTYDEAKKMLDSLNKNGEFKPYTMVEV